MDGSYVRCMLVCLLLAIATAQDDKSGQKGCTESSENRGSIGDRLSTSQELMMRAALDLDSCAIGCMNTPNCTVFLYCNSTVACAAAGEGGVEKACLLGRGPFSASSASAEGRLTGVTVGICEAPASSDVVSAPSSYRWTPSLTTQDTTRTEGIVLSESHPPQGKGN